MKLGEQLEQFKSLSKQLLKALEQNNYSKAENIAFKQQMLIDETANNYPKTPSLELENQWISEIKSYRDIRISLELQLKKLNTKTKKKPQAPKRLYKQAVKTNLFQYL